MHMHCWLCERTHMCCTPAPSMEALAAAADAIASSPLPPTDEVAREFLDTHPIENIFR